MLGAAVEQKLNGEVVDIDVDAESTPPSLDRYSAVLSRDFALSRGLSHHPKNGENANYYYYVVFSLFRSAAIIQGVYKRGLDGNASSELAVKFGGVAAGRAEALVGEGWLGYEPLFGSWV